MIKFYNRALKRTRIKCETKNLTVYRHPNKKILDMTMICQIAVIIGHKGPQQLMPFGKGERICPGAELARLEMMVFLHHLILQWDWKLAEPEHPVITPNLEFPKGLQIKVRALVDK